ncbi:hypothetical protein [Pleionea sp. CnH1-48]|uniref:hypothetical protein n=1 Tax=Pleionea sp. CnH1-48 TaxID=2954494 RepID=UPI0020984AB9|nr:hypothetical protein [Pleionea sp. CnH1-48]MCO7225997.1 hypothetical protein [Pleionea sp. CnH1-48]
MDNDRQVKPSSATFSHNTRFDQQQLNQLMIGESLEENLFKIQHVLAVIQYGFTPPGSDIPIKEAAIAGFDFLLEYMQQLVEVEIDRLSVKA